MGKLFYDAEKIVEEVLDDSNKLPFLNNQVLNLRSAGTELLIAIINFEDKALSLDLEHPLLRKAKQSQKCAQQLETTGHQCLKPSPQKVANHAEEPNTNVLHRSLCALNKIRLRLLRIRNS